MNIKEIQLYVIKIYVIVGLSSDMLLKATKELDETKSELSGLVNEEAKRNRFAKAGEYYVLCIS